MKLWHNRRKNETKQEESTNIQQKEATQQQKNIECEEAIIKDKQRFGRVRTGTMQVLREQYGETIADRAMWRVRKRKTRGSLQGNDPFSQDSSLQDLARLFSQL